MENQKEIPLTVREVSLDQIHRIDAALEGDWNSTLVTIWTRTKGSTGFSDVTRVHPTFKPSLELYFKDTWIGLHCFNLIKGEYVFDENFARKIISYVESNL